MNINALKPDLHSPLAKTFWATAAEQNADIYLDSFGCPYFFHRTMVMTSAPAAPEHGQSVHWRMRCMQVKLVSTLQAVLSPKTTNVRHLPYATASAMFLSDHLKQDAFFRELLLKHRERYHFYGAYNEGGAGTAWDWQKIENWQVIDDKRRVIAEIHRFPLEAFPHEPHLQA